MIDFFDRTSIIKDIEEYNGTHPDDNRMDVKELQKEQRKANRTLEGLLCNNEVYQMMNGLLFKAFLAGQINALNQIKDYGKEERE